MNIWWGGEVPLLPPYQEKVNNKLYETTSGGGYVTFIGPTGKKLTEKLYETTS